MTFSQNSGTFDFPCQFSRCFRTFIYEKQLQPGVKGGVDLLYEFLAPRPCGAVEVVSVHHLEHILEVRPDVFTLGQGVVLQHLLVAPQMARIA